MKSVLRVLFNGSFFLGVTFWVVLDARAAYMAPIGGWTYSYDGSTAATSSTEALDGTWRHDSGSDNWDLSAPGGTLGPTNSPGGVGSFSDGVETFLRIQDTGDPRDYGYFPTGTDLSNRRIYFVKETGSLISATPLDSGITLNFRVRLSTPGTVPGALDDLFPDGGGGSEPFPAGGDGYVIHDGGKATLGVHQGGSPRKSLGFSIDPDKGLLLNNLNGTSPTGTVDTGESGTENAVSIGDATNWHEFWISVQPGGSGTHQASIYIDGSLTPTVVDFTAGNGGDISATHLFLAQGSTAQSGAIDVDFVNIYNGVIAPVPEPSAIMLMGFAVLGLGVWMKRHPT